MDKTPATLRKIVAPEKGWGYLVMVAVFVVHLTSVVPLCIFGIVYGEFLTELGNESYGTTFSSAIFIVCMNLSGLLSYYLLRKYSFRQIGFLGAAIQSISYFSLIFIKNLPMFLIFYGLLGGVGSGLMFPAAFSSLNDYFHKRLDLMTGLAQILITIATMVYPPIMAHSMERFGFVCTKLLLALISTSSFFAIWVLHPVEWHSKEYEADPLPEKSPLNLENENTAQLLDRKPHEIETGIVSAPMYKNSTKIQTKPLTVSTLLKSAKYINIVMGLSIAFTGDNLFVSVIRMVLHDLGFNTFEVATMSMVLFGCDLFSRVVYCVVSAIFTINNRYLFYGGCLLTAIFRIAYTVRDDFLWRILNLAVLGFVRTSIQTSFTLVIAEEYRENFSTAYSILLVCNGLVGLTLGPLMNAVKNWTHSDTMLLHVLTAGILICVIGWTVEFVYNSIKKKS